jgi:hypothetical protein
MIYKNRKRQYWQEFKYWLVQLLLKNISRVEVIEKDKFSNNNRLYVNYKEFEFSCQDDFRTLKIFVK